MSSSELDVSFRNESDPHPKSSVRRRDPLNDMQYLQKEVQLFLLFNNTRELIKYIVRNAKCCMYHWADGDRFHSLFLLSLPLLFVLLLLILLLFGNG